MLNSLMWTAKRDGYRVQMDIRFIGKDGKMTRVVSIGDEPCKEVEFGYVHQD